MTRVVGVIQARCGSTRFPRKVLAPLEGRPMLAHVVQRVSLATSIDRVVVATTTETDDDAVAALAIANGAGVTRGSVDDVLSRYVQAAREHGADVVVRVSGDCPLIDPMIIDQVVRTRAAHDADYAENVEPPTYPEGYDVEALTSACLFRIDGEATQPYEREHVTPRIKEHRADFHTVHVACSRDLSWIRLTVDVPQDLARVAAVLASLPAHPLPGLEAVAAVIERDPALRDQRGLPIRNERYLAQRAAAADDRAVR
jgi:spore coat polysaccharide biosynthesis protein SpsF (cytidylyltransferase family)